jgi:hypothetical protein
LNVIDRAISVKYGPGNTGSSWHTARGDNERCQDRGCGTIRLMMISDWTRRTLAAPEYAAEHVGASTAPASVLASAADLAIDHRMSLWDAIKLAAAALMVCAAATI